MPTRDDIVLLAACNASMNGRLYAAAALLPQDALHADRGAFFGSVMGTLNHIVARDIIWLRRFRGHPSGFASLNAMADMPVPAGLGHAFGEELAPLLALRVRLDAVITALAAEVIDVDLAKPLPYKNARGDFRKNFVGR